jgi:hypothetical protein
LVSFFLFDPRRRLFRVLRSPAFAAGAATPYGHDRATEKAITCGWYGSNCPEQSASMVAGLCFYQDRSGNFG